MDDVDTNNNNYYVYNIYIYNVSRVKFVQTCRVNMFVYEHVRVNSETVMFIFFTRFFFFFFVRVNSMFMLMTYDCVFFLNIH